MAERKRRPPLPRGFWPVWTTVVIDLIGFGIVVPILPLYAERFGAKGFTAGLLFAVFSAAQFALAPIVGKLSDRIGRRPVLMISLVGTAVASLITGAAGSLWVLFVGRALDGASGASTAVAQAAAADLAPPQERPRLMGLIGAAFGIGFVVGPAIGALASIGGPRLPFFIAAGLAALNAVAAWIRVPETRHGDRPSESWAVPASARRALSPELRRLAIVAFVTTVAFAGFETTFGLFAKRRLGIGQRGVSLVFVAVGVVLVAVQGGLFHRFVERRGTRLAYLAGLTLMTIGLATLGLAEGWGVLAVTLLALTVGQGLASPSLTQLVAEHAPPQRRGQAMGYQQSAAAVGRILGPPLGGLLFDHAAVWAPFAFGAALCALVIGVASR